MRVKYKLFPYPVLNEQLDDYRENKFQVEMTIQRDINDIRFQFSAFIEDTKIKKMLEDEDVELIYHIECSKTLFRQVYKTKALDYSVGIEEKNMNGKVDICCFIVAKKHIVSYSNDNFNDDYKGIAFELLKGNILAFYNLPRVEFTKNPEELAQLASIFSVIKKEDATDGMDIEFTEEKIKVCLGNEAFLQYKNFAKLPLYQPMIHSMIIFPALLYAFEMIEKNGVDEYSESRWFKGIEKKLSVSNILLNKESIERYTSYKLAQKLLNLPINRALNNMKHEEEEIV